MNKLTYTRDNDTKRYKRNPYYLKEIDLAIEQFATILMDGGIDFYAKALKSGPRGYIADMYDVTYWDEDTYILGSPPSHLKGLREKDNKKITVNRREFIALLELWLKLISDNAEEIILEREGDVISLSGNGERTEVHWADFKYDWENEDEEIYDF